FVLADEINRSPAKVQSALLEAMAEHQVTIGDETFTMEEPFLVMATQNPLEQEGTYQLPEAQLDRFMLKCVISYPTMEDERQIIRMNVSGQSPSISPVVSIPQIRAAQKAVRDIYLDEKIEQYILDIVFATRSPAAHKLEKLAPLLSYGGSPRASINLALAAKAYAFVQKRAFVIPEDVRAIVQDVLRHRIGLTYEAEAENMTPEEIIAQIVRVIPVP
ncbi:MAG: MoxR family ATPase, partial [Bacteroidia bacterium]|nr:MoxR family ATPase [Bacteroidia bacterium]